VSLDTDLPAFRAGLARLVEIRRGYDAAVQRGGVVGKLRQAGWAARGAMTFARLYLLPVKRHELPAQIRMEPAW
jgi:magnesium-protoporphyrin IX monomethyl ester (oxidative) cyclase